MRTITSLCDNWYFSKTSEIPSSLPASWECVTLPHTWNNKDGQDGGNDYWRGTACYAKELSVPAHADADRVFLEVKGAAMSACVFLNGKKLAEHRGGYSLFRVDLTDDLADSNLLCITVDNSDNDVVYPQKADFTFYGGLYREVSLVTVPAVHFELVKDGSSGLKITPEVFLDEHRAVVRTEAWCAGGDAVRFVTAGQEKTADVKDGYACAEFEIENVHLWDGLDDPYMYACEAVLLENGEEKDTVCSKYGCRTFRIDPEKGFFLNGRSYPLRGVSRHQDRAELGNALTIKEHREDMEMIREIGANTIRLAHYQHAQEFYDLCDEYGMVVWAEIPYITMHMDNGRENTITQMRELITQCYNHPSIVCWGLSNEITASGKVTEGLMENHRELNDLCHRMDPTRPTVMAHAFMLEQESELIPIADLASYNLYFGWYLGELEQNDSFFDEYHAKYPERVIGFSEYGADANPQYQDSNPERGDYSETYQCVYHEHILKCIEERPYLWATHVWNMFDFAADGRDEGGKHGVNQKGLVTMDRAVKKDAFYLYKAAWNKKDAFVHLCGRRYVNRCEDKTEVKVYSNQPAVELYVDGALFAKQEGRTVFVFEVPLSGEHVIEARAGECTDTIKVCRAAEQDASYQFRQKGDVINWFDKESFKDDCFSIKDTLGDLMKHPVAGQIIGRLMAGLQASRGDVAKEASANPNLQKMMAGMKLESLLKQAGPAVKAEQIVALNEALQKIKKN